MIEVFLKSFRNLVVNFFIALESYLLFGISTYVNLFSPSNLKRYESDLSYSEFQFTTAQHNRRFLSYLNFLSGCSIVVDIGCGEGGKTVYYSLNNLAKIIGMDVDFLAIKKARAFSQLKESANIAFVVGDIKKPVIKEKIVDCVISEGGFEHFRDLDEILQGVNNILKEEGIFLIGFIPYNSADGHHMYNYIRVPWAHVFFLKQAIINASKMIAGTKCYTKLHLREDIKVQLDKEIRQFSFFLNRITIRRFKEYLMRSQKWRLIDLQYYSQKNFPYRLNTLSFFREINSSVFCILQKIEGSHITEDDIAVKEQYFP